ncbi:MAG: beta-galactosidase [Treponema sp.]|nr:beta-galactosidase [Treponema sp.]
MSVTHLPQYPYGAVYFRKSGPPREDWERDYAQARKDGMNTFRHWFMWESIEVAPGVYRWEDWDAQLDLAAKYGIKTIIGECLHSAPEWAYRLYDHARFQNEDGHKVFPHIRNSSATGGYSGLCLDNEDYRELAGNFLTVLAKRYKGHPGLLGYDLWNENNLYSSGHHRCFCPASHEKFHEWLRKKYGDIKNVAEAWRRYGMVEWSDVLVPHFLDMNPECFDYSEYSVENAGRLLQWRADTIKAVDPDVLITGHGVNLGSLERRFGAADDIWHYAKITDINGHSGGGGMGEMKEGPKRWYKIMGADLCRAGSNGKPFWAAERTSGPKWQSIDGRYHNVLDEFGQPLKTDPNVPPGKEKPKGVDLRINDLLQMACGTRGILSNRYRGLLDGHLFGMMGYYSNDGSPTDRSEMAAIIAKWANDPKNADIWKANPVRGDIAILCCPETQIFIKLLMQSTGPYLTTIGGVYSAFMDRGVQPDLASLEQIDKYNVVYLPCPVMLKLDTIKRIINWVSSGGILISDGLPGYFSDGGHSSPVQPANGFEELFGCRELEINFFPMSIRYDKEKISILGMSSAPAGFYTQSYVPGKGKAVGWFADGSVAAVENTYGKGRTLLIGTVPGLTFGEMPADEGREYFRRVQEWAGVEQQIINENPLMIARLHSGGDKTFLWILNPTRNEVMGNLVLSSKWRDKAILGTRYGSGYSVKKGCRIEVMIPPMDGLVLELQ